MKKAKEDDEAISKADEAILNMERHITEQSQIIEKIKKDFVKK
jgi:hypothetical protein